MTLREKIGEALIDAYEDAYCDGEYGERDSVKLIPHTTTRILAAVRETMLIGADGFIVAKDENGKSLGAFATKPWMEQILTVTGITESEVENDTD